MVGPVDFDKSVDYWLQDKWSGQFSVKWHLIKDVPNSLFRHILLENNDNKPVTNSRDTQEVRIYLPFLIYSWSKNKDGIVVYFKKKRMTISSCFSAYLIKHHLKLLLFFSPETDIHEIRHEYKLVNDVAQQDRVC